MFNYNTRSSRMSSTVPLSSTGEMSVGVGSELVKVNNESEGVTDIKVDSERVMEDMRAKLDVTYDMMTQFVSQIASLNSMMEKKLEMITRISTLRTGSSNMTRLGYWMM